jgi:hypothetical protein
MVPSAATATAAAAAAAGDLSHRGSPPARGRAEGIKCV